MEQKVSIKQFYEDAEVFITGGSGFIGKALIEKLLRSCPKIKSIYILMRPKKKELASERIHKLTDDLLFEFLKKEHPDALEKLHAIEGDIMELGLGISDSDMIKLKSCSVIFHAAASVRFDDPLKEAIITNTRGTREVCKLALTMTNLMALIHVSTAYVQPKNSYVQEKMYPSDGDWRDYIKYAETFDYDVISRLSLKLTRFAPNTYTFTKHLAEHVCNDYKKEFNVPIVIFRPSIVSVSEVEPFAGWYDNLNGPMGLANVSILAVNHVVGSKGTDKLDGVPVDMCIKGMIVAAWKQWKDHRFSAVQSDDISVYNAASVKIASYDGMTMTLGDMVRQCPSANMLGIPSVTFTPSIVYGWIIRIFRNLIPALIIDVMLRLSGNKPRFMKIHRLIHNSQVSLKYFYTRSFKFDNFNFFDLNHDIPENEKEQFQICEKSKSNADYYFNGYKMGLKLIFRETAEDEANARRRYPYIYCITRSIHVIVLFSGLKLFCALFNRCFK